MPNDGEQPKGGSNPGDGKSGGAAPPAPNDPKTAAAPSGPSPLDFAKHGRISLDRALFPLVDGTDVHLWLRDLPRAATEALTGIEDYAINQFRDQMAARQFETVSPEMRRLLLDYRGADAAKAQTMHVTVGENTPSVAALIEEHMLYQGLGALDDARPDTKKRLVDGAKQGAIDLAWRTFPNQMKTIDSSLVGARRAWTELREGSPATRSQKGDALSIVLDGEIFNDDHVLPLRSDQKAVLEFLKERRERASGDAGGQPGEPFELKNDFRGPNIKLKMSMDVDALKLAQYPRRANAFKSWTLGFELKETIDTPDYHLQFKLAPSLTEKLKGVPKTAGLGEVFDVTRYGTVGVDGSLSFILKGRLSLNVTGTAHAAIHDPQAIDYSVMASLEIGGLPDRLISQIRGWDAPNDPIGKLTTHELREELLGHEKHQGAPLHASPPKGGPPPGPELPADPTDPFGKHAPQKPVDDYMKRFEPELPPPEPKNKPPSGR